ncbi:MAG: hypothetical protein JO327_14240 [Nitrososphaeraceae archaeon]|nr:hypothetical protein [Nitrososphaeraceae archaeon]MBV9669272.1 hypothetical protein [Nitrososphaeraceae archaeon]
MILKYIYLCLLRSNALEQSDKDKGRVCYDTSIIKDEFWAVVYRKNGSLSPSSTVLELGCGFGRITKWFCLLSKYRRIFCSKFVTTLNKNVKEYVRPQEIIIKRRES